MRTSFHHQPEAQHPKSSAIHKLPADYPIFGSKADIALSLDYVRFTPESGHGELASICPLSAITGLDWYDCRYEAAGGAQPFGASSKPLKSNPGATVQLNSVHSPRLCAACQACAGTIACGRSPATRSAPSVTHSGGPFASAAISSLSGAPAW